MKKNILQFFLITTLVLCSACTRSYLQVEKVQSNNAAYAASFARSPHPYTLNPPKGEKLYINWSIPTGFKPHMYRLKVNIIYRDLSLETAYYPIARRAGARIIELLGNDFKKKKGFLAYKMEIVSVDGAVLTDYTHRMYVDIILPCKGA